jgi:hypothetical protein
MDTLLEEMMLLQGGGHEKAQAREESSWARGDEPGCGGAARARAVLGPPEDRDHPADPWRAVLMDLRTGPAPTVMWIEEEGP